MRVSCFNTLDDLARYADAWDRLADGIPFRSWTWLSHWWRHYGPRSGDLRTRLAVLCVFDDADNLMGIAPWYLDRSALHGRVLRPLGSGEVCSDYLGLLCHPAVEELVVEALAEYLDEIASCGGLDALPWDLLELDGVDAEDRCVADLANAMAVAGATVHRRPGMNCWRLKLPTDWNDYVASLGPNLRREVRRLERDLLGTNHATLHSITHLSELPRAMDLLVDLHQRRHKSLGRAGCFASQRFLGFYRDVVPDLLSRGQVQFYWLELDGRPAAAEFQLVGKGSLYAYQAGVDPDFLQQEPGKLINMMILRRAIEQGCLAFDFLRGDEPYKARFGARPRPTIEYRIVPRRTVAQLRHNLWLTGMNVKEWVKKGFSETANIEKGT